MYQAKTLRRLPPLTRNLCRQLNDIERALNRIKRSVDNIRLAESEAIATHVRQEHYKNNGKVDPIDWKQDSIVPKFNKDWSEIH